MAMIIAIIYILFILYNIWSTVDQLSENPQAPLEKIHASLKIQKVLVFPFLPTLKIFQVPPAESRMAWGRR